MPIIWLGVLLVVVGVIYMAAQPIWRARLSRRSPTDVASGTLEPRRPGAGLGIKANWPGLAMIALGAILIFAGAAI